MCQLTMSNSTLMRENQRYQIRFKVSQNSITRIPFNFNKILTNNFLLFLKRYLIILSEK